MKNRLRKAGRGEKNRALPCLRTCTCLWKTHLTGLDVLQKRKEEHVSNRAGTGCKPRSRTKSCFCCFCFDGSENEHVSKGSVWKRAPHPQTAFIRLSSDRFPEERQPVYWRKEEDVFFFTQMSTGHHQRENQR